MEQQQYAIIKLYEDGHEEEVEIMYDEDEAYKLTRQWNLNHQDSYLKVKKRIINV